MWLRELVEDRLLICIRHLVTALEQGRDRHTEEYRDLQQPAASDTIGSLLVFLDLLECQIELISELGLSESFLQTIDPDIAADDSVDGVRSLASHHNPTFPQQRKSLWTSDLRVQE